MDYNLAYHSDLEEPYAQQKTQRDLHLVVSNNNGFVDRLLSYLEKEDNWAEQVIGYGLCAFTFLYFLVGAVCRALV